MNKFGITTWEEYFNIYNELIIQNRIATNFMFIISIFLVIFLCGILWLSFKQVETKKKYPLKFLGILLCVSIILEIFSFGIIEHIEIKRRDLVEEWYQYLILSKYQ